MTATVVLCALASIMYFAVALFEKLMNGIYKWKFNILHEEVFTDELCESAKLMNGIYK